MTEAVEDMGTFVNDQCASDIKFKINSAPGESTTVFAHKVTLRCIKQTL